jgi:predicted protein tyrosine phosphatase
MAKPKLIVTSRAIAEKYNPSSDGKVLLIRIFSHSDKTKHRPLDFHSSFYKVREFFFDDTENEKPDGIPFTEKDAKEIIEFVTENINDVDYIYVHCLMGLSRSPGLAMALNIIFDLDYDDSILYKQFPLYNRVVYNTMLKVAQKNFTNYK